MSVMVLSRAVLFIGLIALGYLLKRAGIFKPEDHRVLANIIFMVTLPAVLITSFREFTFHSSMFLFVLLGALMNVCMLLFGAFIGRKRDSTTMGTYMLCGSGYNISLFVIPFVSSFLGPQYLAVVAMFDIGNLVMGLGGSCILSSCVEKTKNSITKKELFKSLYTNVPFLVYLLMLILAILGLNMPSQVYAFTEPISKANTILVMFMIGIIFEFRIKTRQWKDVVRILLLRYGCALAIISLLFYFLPASSVSGNAMKVIMLAPVTAISPILCQRMGYNDKLASILFSICIPTSLVATIALVLRLQIV